MSYLGDFPEDATVRFLFTTHAAAGGAVAPSDAFEAGDLKIYKAGSATQKTSTNGITMTSPFDSVVGLHAVAIDTSNDTGDADFWVAGGEYEVVLDPDETVDGKTERAVLHSFSLERSGGALARAKDIQARLPAVLGANGGIKSDVRDFGGVAGAFSGGRPECNATHVGGSAIQQAGGYVRARDGSDAALATQATAAAAQAAAEAARDDLANGTDGLGALMTAVTNLTGNTTSSAVAPKAMERPDSGSKTYRLHLMLYDLDGQMEAPDSAPTVAAENDQGTDRSANLSAVVAVSTGHYRVDYTVASDHALEALTVIWTVVEAGKTRKVAVATYVAETTAELFTAADRAKLDTLHDNRLTAGRAAYLDELAPANIPADVDTLKTRLPGVVQPQTGDAYARLGAPAGASIAADVAAVLEAIGALNDVSTAEIQTAVLAALGTGRAELSALPAAGASPLDKLELVFMAVRNLILQSATERKIHRADGTVLGTSAVSDAAGVLSIGRMT